MYLWIDECFIGDCGFLEYGMFCWIFLKFFVLLFKDNDNYILSLLFIMLIMYLEIIDLYKVNKV